MNTTLYDHGVTFELELRIKFSRRAERPFSARVEFAVMRSWGWVYVEVDELQHKTYPEGNDAERMQLILAERMIDGKPGEVHIVRANPDSCLLNGARQTFPLKDRVDALVAVLAFEPVKQYAVTYMYYICSGPLPGVCLSVAYPTSLRDIVLNVSYLHPSLAHGTCD